MSTVGVSHWLWRAALVGCATVWAFVMVVVGLLAIIDWPDRFAAPGRLFYISVGAILLAAGEFIFAVTAARMFPQASTRLTAAMELLPAAMLVVLILVGVLLWV